MPNVVRWPRFRRDDALARDGRHRLRRRRDRRRDDRRGHRARRRRRGACASPSSTRATSPRARAPSPPRWSTAACATSASASSAWSHENLRERQRLLDNAPYLVRRSPSSSPSSAATAWCQARGRPRLPTALCLYDLTGGVADRPAPRERLDATRRSRTCRASTSTGWSRASSTATRAATTRASRSPSRAPRRSTSAPSSPPTPAVTGVTRDEAGAPSGSTVARRAGRAAPHGFARAQRGQRDRGLGRRGRDLGRRGRRASRHAGQGRARDRASLAAARCDVAAVLPRARGPRAASSSSRSRTRPTPTSARPTPPTTGRSTTRGATAEDVDYLLGAVNASTSAALTRADVTGVWAGLRPLLAAATGTARSERTADLSRRHRVTDSGDGVVHVTGGKWTTYRQMAEDTVDELAPYLRRLARVRAPSALAPARRRRRGARRGAREAHLDRATARTPRASVLDLARDAAPGLEPAIAGPALPRRRVRLRRARTRWRRRSSTCSAGAPAPTSRTRAPRSPRRRRVAAPRRRRARLDARGVRPPGRRLPRARARASSTPRGSGLVA